MQVIMPTLDEPGKLKMSEICHITEVNASKLQAVDSNLVCAEQMWNNTCKN